MGKFSHIKLTDVLIEEGLITTTQIDELIQMEKDKSAGLEEMIVKSGIIDKNTLMSRKAEMIHTRYVDVSCYPGYEEFVHLLPEATCRKYSLICINKVENKLSLVMTNPSDVSSIDDIRLVSGYEIEPLLGYEPDIKFALNQVFGDQAFQNIVDVAFMSGLNITEKRLPQDGRVQMNIKGKSIDLRISILPTIAGEGVVIRILDRASISLKLEDIGLIPSMAENFKASVSQPNGMIMVTGPTGSGKTTTLYAVLNTLNSPTKKILTIEDPVEYYLYGINQVQVKPTIGFTFATGLRTFFRQDPDIIMVGEVRDFETAQTAIEAALTGHLVLSTLHTNDAIGTVVRLIDMGIKSFLIASTLRCVLAQRLARVICPNCKEPIQPSGNLLKFMDKLSIPIPDNIQLFKGKGCNVCNRTGYKGRIGIFELLIMSTELERGVTDKASSLHLLEIAKQEGLKTLLEDGIEKVLQGLTTIEEIFRVVHNL
ncbi:Flp pilus assembly complex ATPase component TadA [Candidatus Desantisbacteria bacterium]|nr:Flp pilus assembly complex ATPase component TadA [Candidatus Desantisbacteria bacterium]